MKENRPLKELFDKLGITPNNPLVYEEAFTHSSSNAAAGTKHFDYERLEFLGDSLVGFVVSELAFIYHPEMQQGDLSRLKSQWIRTESEASMALSLDLGSYIRVGNSFSGEIIESSRLLEDVFESFLGALLLDQGKEYAYRFTRSLFEKDIAQSGIWNADNPKSALQEAIQSEWKEAVTYRLLEERGKSNDKRYLIGVYFEDLELGRGEGKSKKEAEIEAAKDALRKNAKAALEFERKKGK